MSEKRRATERKSERKSERQTERESELKSERAPDVDSAGVYFVSFEEFGGFWPKGSLKAGSPSKQASTQEAVTPQSSVGE